MDRTPEKKAEIYTLANQDALAGFPMNRFLRDDPDYKEGWEDAQKLMKHVIEKGIPS